MITPATIRNHNPGAIYPGPSARKFGGSSRANAEVLKSADGKHPISAFPTDIHGAAALFDNLMHAGGVRHYYYRGQTLAKAIDTWCGSIRTASYLALIKQQTGLEPTEILTEEFLRDHDRAIPLAKAIARHETGKDFPLDQMAWLEAHAMAFSGGHIAPAPSANNDVPTLRPEARWEAKVERAKSTSAMLGLAGSAGSAAVTSPQWLPVVPQAFSDTIVNLKAWQAFGGKLLALPAELQATGIGVGVAMGAGIILAKVLKQ